MKGPDRESLSLWNFLKIRNQFLQRLQGTSLQNWILQIVCLENKFVDASKAVLKKIISEYISSSNYNVDDDDITVEEDECHGALMKSASYRKQQRLWLMVSYLYRDKKNTFEHIFLRFSFLEKVLHRLRGKSSLLDNF